MASKQFYPTLCRYVFVFSLPESFRLLPDFSGSLSQCFSSEQFLLLITYSDIMTFQFPLPAGGNGAGSPPKVSEETAGALGKGEKFSNAFVLLFSFLAYVIPIFGAWWADTRLGRYKVCQIILVTFDCYSSEEVSGAWSHPTIQSRVITKQNCFRLLLLVSWSVVSHKSP
jgi:hypothetical protein